MTKKFKQEFHDSCVPEMMQLPDSAFNEACQKVSFDYVEAIIGEECEVKENREIKFEDGSLSEQEIITLNRRVLACYKFRPHWESLWPFGGRVIPRETIKAAVQRQIANKLGAYVSPSEIDIVPFPLAFLSTNKKGDLLMQTRSVIVWINASPALSAKIHDINHLAEQGYGQGLLSLNIDYCCSEDMLFGMDETEIGPAMSEILVHVYEYLELKRGLKERPDLYKIFKSMEARAGKVIEVQHK